MARPQAALDPKASRKLSAAFLTGSESAVSLRSHSEQLSLKLSTGCLGVGDFKRISPSGGPAGLCDARGPKTKCAEGLTAVRGV